MAHWLCCPQAAESLQKYAYAESIPHISSFQYRIISGTSSQEKTIDIQPGDNLLIVSKDSIGRNLDRLDTWLKGKNELYLVVDEAHHSTAKTYRKGWLKMLTNVNILTEGVDRPKIKSVFLARPTVSSIMMTQMVGRALRGQTAGETDSAYIVSFIDHWNEHIAWVNPESLFEGSNDFADSPPLPIWKRAGWTTPIR